MKPEIAIAVVIGSIVGGTARVAITACLFPGPFTALYSYVMLLVGVVLEVYGA